MRKRSYLAFLDSLLCGFLSFVIVAGSSVSVAEETEASAGGSMAMGARLIDAESIAAHIRFLADDLLEGRGPGTKSDAITQLYIATQLQSLGYQPAGQDGGYTQAVPLVGLTSSPPQTIAIAKSTAGSGSDSEQIELKYYQDFIAVSGMVESEVSIDAANLVFVGFGITAPEYQWDDYANTDVSGKIVVVMNNDPEDDPDLFEGRRRLYYGRWDYKYANAAAHGAAGAIIIHTTASAGYPFSVVQTSWSGEESELREDDSPRLKVKAWVTDEAAHKIVELASQDLEKLRAAANQRGFKPVDLKLTTSVKIEVQITQNDTANILAIFPGSDPEVADEYVMLMAHHDHIGRATERNASGDDIYNGAIDNASGTATLLSMARAFAIAGKMNLEKPRRSILIAAVGAEEQGLLGSKYFAAHPTVPAGKIAGLINMDGMNFLGRTIDLQVVGYGKSSIDVLVSQVAELQNRKVVPDQFIDRGYYYRSDQFSLARIGVPGLYLHSGTAVRGKPDDWGRQQVELWTETDYHQPSDEYKTDWDLSGAVEDTQLLYEIALRIANADAMQAWNSGDEFEAARFNEIEKIRQ